MIEDWDNIKKKLLRIVIITIIVNVVFISAVIISGTQKDWFTLSIFFVLPVIPILYVLTNFFFDDEEEDK